MNNAWAHGIFTKFVMGNQGMSWDVFLSKVLSTLVEVSDNNLPFLHIIVKDQGSEIWMNLYFKSTDLKRYVPSDLIHAKPCLKKPFCLAQGTCAIFGNVNIRTATLSVSKQS